jgi:hypothetical protein
MTDYNKPHKRHTTDWPTNLFLVTDKRLTSTALVFAFENEEAFQRYMTDHFESFDPGREYPLPCWTHEWITLEKKCGDHAIYSRENEGIVDVESLDNGIGRILNVKQMKQQGEWG